MKISLKFSIIFLLCLTSINSECPSGNSVLESDCDSTSCDWSEVTAEGCGGTSTQSGVTCGATQTTSSDCTTAGCTWSAAKGTCTAKATGGGTGGGSGSGSGSGTGTESGSGSGSGTGTESGSGSGSGTGTESGSGSGSGTGSSSDTKNNGVIGLKNYAFGFLVILLF